MNLALACRELWRQKVLVAVGIPVALIAAVISVSNVSLLPPKIGGGTLQYYSARTQILVDSDSSSIGDLNRDLTPMVTRANVYSRFLTTPAALNVIGHNAGIPADEIYAEGPYQLGQPRFIQEPTAERRGSQLIGRQARYRLRFDSDPELPIVTVYAEAPSADQATALANGAATGLSDYVTRLQDEQGIPQSSRVAIRRLGSSAGAPVTPGASTKVALFVFFVVIALWCVGVLVALRLRNTWRQADAAERSGGVPPAKSLGDNGKVPREVSEDQVRDMELKLRHGG
ncbi:MAG TPA: hypothetical protein VH329_00045 [Solirubrobacterales bacterium]